MRLLKVAVMAIIMTLIGWVGGYQVGKRASDKYWQVTKVMTFPAGMNCWECGHLPLPSPTHKVDPQAPYTKPDTTDFTSTKSAKVGPCSPGEDYQGGWCMMILPGANMIEGKVCHYVESTNMTWCIYKPNYKPKGCAKAGECEPTNYWVICDDGYVRFGKAIVDDDLKVKACGLHGAVDNRRIHISSTEGKDWKVIVTPINPKGKLEDQK